MSTDAPKTDRPLRTVAGVPTTYAAQANDLLQERLVALIDLGLTLKHVHWNVVGPNFISVHEMIDQFNEEVRPMVDEMAERIRTLGGVPNGLPGGIVEQRSWEDYPLHEAPTTDHLRALDDVYEHMLLDHRRTLAQIANLDPITEDLMIGHIATLEQQQWFIRSFLKGEQLDAEETRFGRADRMPTDEESKAAEELDLSANGTGEKYREMAKIGASVKGEGQIES